jgi:hypothetical protein
MYPYTIWCSTPIVYRLSLYKPREVLFLTYINMQPVTLRGYTVPPNNSLRQHGIMPPSSFSLAAAAWLLAVAVAELLQTSLTIQHH